MAQTKINPVMSKVFTTCHMWVVKLSGGKIGGGVVKGGDIIILETKGAKSGKTRKNPLLGGPHDDGWIVIASFTGHDYNPSWYYNLKANPDATVDLRKEVTKVRARETEGEERQQLWDVMAGLYPDYNAYAEVTDREIPVLVLEKVD